MKLSPNERNDLYGHILPQAIKIFEKELLCRIGSDDVCIIGDFYCYVPNSKKLNWWLADDGVDVNCSLQTLLTEYAWGEQDLYWRLNVDDLQDAVSVGGGDAVVVDGSAQDKGPAKPAVSPLDPVIVLPGDILFEGPLTLQGQ